MKRRIPFLLLLPFLIPFMNNCEREEVEEEAYPTGIEIDPGTGEIPVGETFTFTATGVYSDGSEKDVTREAVWASTDESVALVDEGVAEGAGEGLATITASWEGFTSNEAALSVILLLEAITISPEYSEVETRDSLEFQAAGTYHEGTEKDITRDVEWYVGDEDLASIQEGGVLTPIQAGLVEVYATLGDVESNLAQVIITNSTPLEGEIIFNEVLVDGTTDEDANGDGTIDPIEDEFIEFVNTMTGALDISGCIILETAMPALPRHTFPEGTVVLPGEAVVVFGGGEISEDLLAIEGAAFSVSNAEDPGLNFGLAMSNDGDTVSLDCGDFTVASFEYGGDTGINADIDMSLNRDPDITGTDFIGHAWISGSNGALFSPGTRVDGTTF